MTALPKTPVQQFVKKASRTVSKSAAEQLCRRIASFDVEDSDHITEAVSDVERGGTRVHYLSKWTSAEDFTKLFDGSLFSSHEISYIERKAQSGSDGL